MRTPTLNEFKKWAKSHYGLAHAVCVAQAFAQCERERVDAYIVPLFNDYGFRREDGKPVDTPDHLYRCQDEELVKDFYEHSDRMHREHGFKGPHGHCPALVAENLQIKAENALLEAGAVLFGIEDCGIYGENRRDMLHLLLGACLKREAA